MHADFQTGSRAALPPGRLFSQTTSSWARKDLVAVNAVGVSESWFTMTETYGVDIADGQDDVLILACTVVIERCQERSRQRD